MAYDTLSSILQKNKQRQLAGMSTASNQEIAAYTEASAKGERERRIVGQGLREQKETGEAQLALQREGINTQRDINIARMKQEREQFEAETAANEKQYKEQRRDAQKQREISGITSGAMTGYQMGGGGLVGVAVGAGVGYAASGGFDDMTKMNKQAGLLAQTTALGIPIGGEGTKELFSNPSPDSAKEFASSGGGTVICTELYHQGYITQTQLNLENVWVDKYVDNITYNGYRSWADLVVAGMKKSKLFSHIVSIFGKAFVQECNHYAAPSEHKCNILGKIVIHIGMPVCRFLGQFSTVHCLTVKEII